MKKHILEEVHEKPAAGFKASPTAVSCTAKVENPAYQYAHKHVYPNGQVLNDIAILKVDKENPFPHSQDINVVQFILVGEAALSILSSALVLFTNKFNVGAVSVSSEYAKQPLGIAGTLQELETKIEDLTQLINIVKSLPKGVTNFAQELEKKVVETLPLQAKLVERTLKMLGLDTGTVEKQIGHILGAFVKEAFSVLFKPVMHAVLKEVGLFGQAKAVQQYAEQFQTIVTPDAVATAFTDAGFARLAVAGPNPLVIQLVIDKLTDKFAVTNSAYQAVMGDDDSLDEAIAENRLYLNDYEELTGLESGQFPMPKFASAPLVLFAVKKGDKSGQLQPVAIQLGQVAGPDNPIFYPQDEAWPIAKLHAQAADGNYHELISHLGLTHLLIEPFAVSTHRMLSAVHPVFKLLQPHFQGTLFINNAAINSLISPEGTVDSILAGTIESDWDVVTTALESLNFNEHMLPNQLAARHVADPDLPLAYPYRDDAMEVWQAISDWVTEYVGIYYKSDGEVAADTSIQAWVADLTSASGGGISGLGKTNTDGQLGIFTRDYLTEVLTMVIFTASAQHAAVNFPQLAVMSYTPAMPLACYQEPPTVTTSAPALLETLPPLQQAFQQLAVGQLLGGVYFTRLGEYDRHQRGHYFTDSIVQEAVSKFQLALQAVENNIGLRNLTRSHYDALLPSRIPQSINI